METDDDEILDDCSHYGIMHGIASCAHCNPGIYLDYITVSRACDDQTFPPNPGEKQNLLEQYEERTAAVRFEHRVLVQATAVNIVGERCSEDIKEILTKPVDNDGDVKWKKEAANHWHIGKHHLVMDPYEKKSTYVGESDIPGSEEGLFAKQAVMPGQAVSYFRRTKTVYSNTLMNII